METCRKLLLKLESVRIKVSNELLSYSLLGKLAGDSKIHQLIEALTLNEELLEKRDLVLTHLQDYVHLFLRKLSLPLPNPSVSTLVSASNKNFKLIYYCTNGKHNLKNTSHKKEQFLEDKPHLRPNQKDNKRRKFDSSSYLSTIKALITLIDSPPKDKIVVDCGVTHHMFNSRRFFTSLTNSAPIDVVTEDSRSSLTAVRVETANLICKNRVIIPNNCLDVPNIECNLIILLTLFKNKLIINQCRNKFDYETNGKVIANGKILNRLMYVDYVLPKTDLTTSQDILWHNRLGHPEKDVLRS
ncbi:hypothetical protein O181_008096 [Austropuccinia psidii MF-1]|uniref:Retrovirus-related Pol polyprotein from transposon TNT 1-94-like beta-barrel domain-containing protein n=1 Tax=Austropuccinia psidii MF-1 TaxID=1389203 RepID=A0A9Q3BP69_9BASI|nr:hypothetical protein [Austropuccinia psidii MF-1]